MNHYAVIVTVEVNANSEHIAANYVVQALKAGWVELCNPGEVECTVNAVIEEPR